MINNVVISNNSKHNNCSNHKPLTELQYDNNQTAIPKLLLVIIYFSSVTIITEIAYIILFFFGFCHLFQQVHPVEQSDQKKKTMTPYSQKVTFLGCDKVYVKILQINREFVKSKINKDMQNTIFVFNIKIVFYISLFIVVNLLTKQNDLSHTFFVRQS